MSFLFQFREGRVEEVRRKYYTGYNRKGEGEFGEIGSEDKIVVGPIAGVMVWLASHIITI